MPLLKTAPDHPARPAARLVSFEMADIEREAQSLLAGAKRRAEAMVERARADAEAARREAHEQGLAAGRKAGHAEGHAAGLAEGREAAHAEHSERLSKLIGQLDATLIGFDEARVDLARRAVDEVPRLAVAVAERVTKRVGRFDPAVCKENAAAALRLVARSHDVELAVHPDDAAAIRDLLPDFGRRWPTLKHVALVEEDDLAPGGCRVRTAGGLVDADLQTQLDRIAIDLVPEPSP